MMCVRFQTISGYLYYGTCWFGALLLVGVVILLIQALASTGCTSTYGAILAMILTHFVYHNLAVSNHPVICINILYMTSQL